MGAHKLAWWFVDTYEDGDGRLETIDTSYVGTSGVYHGRKDKSLEDGLLRYGAIPRKYSPVTQPNNGWCMYTDLIIYRYADVLTLLSEAIVRNGNAVTPEATQLLNRVRTRSLPGKPHNSFTGVQDFLDKLLLERGHELYWEGHRRSDLIRHGKYVEQMTFKANDAGVISLVTEAHHRYPLPQSVIDEGQGVILQNPGY
jgi:hypothetical protein